MPTHTGKVADADGMVTQYLIDINYCVVTGDKGVPVAGPVGTPQKIIRVHAPYATKVIHWTCERAGGKPLLPHWDTGDPNDVLVSREVDTANPLLGSNQGYVWRVSGKYTYAMKLPPAETASLPTGGTPYDPDSPTIQLIDGDLFVKWLLGPRVQT